jgi:glycosyltransferase involved in cell wall biosynthesis
MRDKTNPPKRLRVLVISDLFPNPPNPALGVFVERQTTHLQSHCDNVVVSPIRIFPHLRLWKQISQPSRFRAQWQGWRTELAQIPDKWQINGVPVHYPRYTSPPKQGFRAMWGFFAYPVLRKKLHVLHKAYSFDLIHAHYASTSGIIALLARRWMQVPVVLSIHGLDLTYAVKQHPLSAAIIRWAFKKSDMVLANSTWTAQQIIHYGGEPAKVQVVFLGGNAAPSFKVTQQPSKVCVAHARSPHLTLLSVSNLHRSKGNAYVLRALRALLDMGYSLKYIIVGEGPYRSHLEELVKELKLEAHISFEGYKAHAEVWPYFAACDIFVLPSWIEGFGIVYIEALGLGKAAIGCQGTAGPEDIKRLCPECIELVKPQDVDSLVEALKALIDDPQKRTRMGALGKELVRQNFTWQRNAEKTMQIYRRVIARKE